MQAPVGAPPGGVLALDLARVTGWAWGHLHWSAPWYGSWHMPETGGEGFRLMCLENEVADAIGEHKPEAVVLEAPLRFLPVRRDRRTGRLRLESNREAMWQQIGMRAIVRCYCARRSIPVSEVSADLVRNDILGFSRVPGHSGAIKRHVVQWCRHHGMRVSDDNQADACMLWCWQRRRLVGPVQRTLAEVA